MNICNLLGYVIANHSKPVPVQNLQCLNACDENVEDDCINKNSADMVVDVVEW